MKCGNRNKGTKPSPKHTLNLPDLDRAKSAVLNRLRSKESQRGYRHAINEFIAWYCSEPKLSFGEAVVTRYRVHLESRELAPGTINGRFAVSGRTPAANTLKGKRDRALLGVLLGRGLRRKEAAELPPPGFPRGKPQT